MQKNVAKRLSVWAGIVAAILAIPFFTKAPWTAGDYIFAGVVLFGSATVYEVTTRNIEDSRHRFAVGAAVAFVLMAIWAWAVA